MTCPVASSVRHAGKRASWSPVLSGLPPGFVGGFTNESAALPQPCASEVAVSGLEMEVTNGSHVRIWKQRGPHRPEGCTGRGRVCIIGGDGVLSGELHGVCVGRGGGGGYYYFTSQKLAQSGQDKPS